jgi:hypothetical protein
MFPRDTLKGFKLSSAIGPRPRPEPRITISGVVIERKPNPWILLHDGSIKTIEQLTEWELLIPQYGCSCKRFYAEWKAANPPDFTSPEAFFAWGVRLHNAVNAKLGKPEITIEEAYKIWRKSDGLEVKTDIEQRP